MAADLIKIVEDAIAAHDTYRYPDMDPFKKVMFPLMREAGIRNTTVDADGIDMLFWCGDKMHHGSWHLHGRCHGSLEHPGRETQGSKGKMTDVGVDAAGDSGPCSFHSLKYIMDMRPIQSYDHHKPHTEEKGDWTL